MAERDPLNLRRLPTELAPRDLWPDIERHLDRRRRWPAVAAAAVVAGLLITVLLSVDRPSPEVPAAAISELEILRAQSAYLESLAGRLRPVAPDDRTSRREVLLQAGLEEVDAALMHYPEHPELWVRRIELLDALSGAYAEEWLSAQAEMTLL